MTGKDGRLVAHENEVRVLRSLHRCGWLRTRDLAALLWKTWATTTPPSGPTLKQPRPTASGLRMAQRTLKRLRKKRWVLSAQAPDGSLVYALAEAGARFLLQLGVPAVTGKDLLRPFSTAHFRHRCVANEIALGAITEGFRVSFEREIAQGRWLGGGQGIEGKRPDALLRNGSAIWWVEVERSRKNAKDYSHLLKWLGLAARDAFRPSGSELLGCHLCWARVIFVCTPAFEIKLRRDLETAGWNKSRIDSFVFFETRLYKFGDILFT